MQNSFNSPVSILASFYSKTPTSPQLTLISGSIGAGKTTWCQELAFQAQLAGVKPQGILSPAVFEQGIKIGIDLLDIHSQERHRLATRKGGGNTSMHTNNAVETPEWRFDPDVLNWANGILEHLSGSEILIVDELGPLEFSRDGGLRSGMSLIDTRDYQHAFVVVRPALLPAAQRRWSWSTVLDITNLGMKPTGIER